MLGDAGRVNLRVAGVSEISAVAIHLHSGGAVGCHGVGGEEEGVAITAGSDYYSVSEEALDAASNEVASDDTACALLAVLVLNHDDIKHLVAVVHLHLALAYLAAECGVCAEEELLTGLTFGIECTADLCATERAVVKQSAVFASERYALRYALVDDVVADLRETIDVRLTSAVVATLDGVVVETIDGVAVVLIVLGCVDTTLCGDGVRTAGRVLDAEVEYVEAHLCEGSRSGSAGKACTYNDDVEAALVSGVDQFLMVFVVGPFLLERTCRNLRHLGRDNLRFFCFCCHIFIDNFTVYNLRFSYAQSSPMPTPR